MYLLEWEHAKTFVQTRGVAEGSSNGRFEAQGEVEYVIPAVDGERQHLTHYDSIQTSTYVIPCWNRDKRRVLQMMTSAH